MRESLATLKYYEHEEVSTEYPNQNRQEVKPELEAHKKWKENPCELREVFPDT